MDTNILSEENKAKNKDSKGFWNFFIEIPIYSLIFLIPIFFLPLTISPFGINKQVLALILVIAASAGFLIKILNQGNIVIFKNKTSLLLKLLVFAAIISSIFSVWQNTSVWGIDGTEADSLANVIIYFLTFFLIVSAAVNFRERLFFKIIFLLLASSAMLELFLVFNLISSRLLKIKFLQFADINFNPVGPLNLLAVYLAAVFVLCLGILANLPPANLENGRKKLKAALVAVSFFAFILLFAIGFRPAFWAIALAAGFLIIFKISQRNRSASKAPAKAAEINLLIAVLALSVVFSFLNIPFIQLYNPQIEVSPSFKESVSILKQEFFSGSGMENVKNILFGSGPFSFVYNYAKYHSPDINQTYFWNARINGASFAYLTYLSEIGLIGAFSILLFFVLFLGKGFINFIGGASDKTALSPFSRGIFVSLLTIFLLSFFVNVNFVLNFTAFVLAALLAVSLSDYEKTTFSLVKTPQRAAIYSFIIILSIAGLLVAVFFVGKKYAAAIYFGQGVQAIQKQNIELSLDKTIKAINLDPQNDVYHRQSAQILFLQWKSTIERNNQTPLSQEEIAAALKDKFQGAINSAKLAAEVNPNESLNWILLGNIYESAILVINGAADFAFDAYGKAEELNPGDPEIKTNIGRAHLSYFEKLSNDLEILSQKKEENGKKIEEISRELKRQSDLSQEKLKQAIALKNDYPQAHLLISHIYDRKGDSGDALKEMIFAKSLLPNDVNVSFQLGLLYYKSNQFDFAKKEFENAVNLLPTYSNARYFLGLIYEQEGDKEAALAQFEEILKYNAGNQAVIQKIEELKKD